MLAGDILDERAFRTLVDVASACQAARVQAVIVRTPLRNPPANSNLLWPFSSRRLDAC